MSKIIYLPISGTSGFFEKSYCETFKIHKNHKFFRSFQTIAIQSLCAMNLSLVFQRKVGQFYGQSWLVGHFQNCRIVP